MHYRVTTIRHTLRWTNRGVGVGEQKKKTVSRVRACERGSYGMLASCVAALSLSAEPLRTDVACNPRVSDSQRQPPAPLSSRFTGCWWPNTTTPACQHAPTFYSAPSSCENFYISEQRYPANITAFYFQELIDAWMRKNSV